MKLLIKIIVIGFALRVCSLVSAQTVTVTVKDNVGTGTHSHTFKSYHDLSPYHDYTGKPDGNGVVIDTEIYLHGMAVGGSWNATYYHARVIHAGYNLLGSNHFWPGDEEEWDPEEDQICPSCSTIVISNNETSNEESGPLGLPLEASVNHSTFRDDYGRDPNWYNGFVVCDGCENRGNNTFQTDGDANLSAWDLDYKSAKTGVVVFRADDQIILSSGFRVLNNPEAKSNNWWAHPLIEIAQNQNGDIIVEVVNHHFHSGDAISHRIKSTVNKPEENDPVYIAFNHTFTIEVIDDDHYKLIGATWPTGGIQSPITSSSYSALAQSSAQLAQYPWPIPKAYFHAYGGPDRFNQQNLWSSDNDLIADFTDPNTVFFDPNNPNSSSFREMSVCGSPFYKDMYSGVSGYDPDMEDWNPKTNVGANPDNVDLSVTDPIIATSSCLRISYTDDPYSCTPINLEASANTSPPQTIFLPNRTTNISPAGIGTDKLDANHCSDELGHEPIYSLHYGKVEWIAKLGKHEEGGSPGQSVALWSYANISDNTEGDLSMGNNGVNAFGNCRKNLGNTNCWKNDMSCGGVDEIDNVDYRSNWFNERWEPMWNAFITNIAYPSTLDDNHIVITGGNGYGAAAHVEEAGGNLIVVIDHPGTGYTSAPTVTIGGRTATVGMNGNGIGSITYPLCTPANSDPTLNNVVFTGGGGPGAAAHVEIVNGKPTVVIDNPGIGFTDRPTVTVGGCSTSFSMAEYGEDEIYHFKVAVMSLLPYGPTFGGISAGTVNFTQIPGNGPGTDGKSWKSFSDGFHYISYEWLPGEIRFLIGADRNNDGDYDDDGEKVEVGRTTRHVPKGYGVNLLATNQINGDFTKQPTSDMFIRKIMAKQLNSSLVHKQAPTSPTTKPNPLISTISVGNIIPNPAESKISFAVMLEDNSNDISAPVKIELFNALGKLEMTQSATQSTNEFTYNFPVNHLATGSYYIRVSCGNRVATKPFVIQR